METSSGHGRVAVVMAATKGLGRGCAEALAASGHRLVICGRREDSVEAAARDLGTAGTEIVGVAADVSRAEDVSRLIATASDEFGRLDVLVANAGGPPAGSFLALSDDQWVTGYDLTLMSAVRAARAAVPVMRANGFGRIVVIGSSSVKQPVENLALSNAYRPALLGVVKTLAQEVARDGITVNMVSPGRIDTDRVRSLDEGRAQARGISYEESRRQAEQSIPMGYYGQPSDLAALVAFLASDGARYITGQSILVDGGMVSAL